MPADFRTTDCVPTILRDHKIAKTRLLKKTSTRPTTSMRYEVPISDLLSNIALLAVNDIRNRALKFLLDHALLAISFT
jgi:hypothetical protein